MTQEKTRALAVTPTLTREQIELIKHTVAVGATDNELALFLYQAQKRGLDPLTRQIYFIKRKQYNPDTEKYEEVGTIQTGIDGFRVVADRTGKLAGINRGTIKDAEGRLIGAWAEVFRKDWQHPAREEVSFKEYCQTKKDGSPMRLWATMPETMLKKVAESAALRMAFPEDLSGIYSHEEMQQADIEITASSLQQATTSTTDDGLKQGINPLTSSEPSATNKVAVTAEQVERREASGRPALPEFKNVPAVWSYAMKEGSTAKEIREKFGVQNPADFKGSVAEAVAILYPKEKRTEEDKLEPPTISGV